MHTYKKTKFEPNQGSGPSFFDIVQFKLNIGLVNAEAAIRGSLQSMKEKTLGIRSQN